MEYYKHFDIVPHNFDLAGAMSSDVKRTLKRLGFGFDFIKRVSVAAYEAEINIVIHSFGGYADFRLTDNTCYLQFIDMGPGIADIGLAMTPGYSTASEESQLNGFGAGMGLINIQKSADEMSLISDQNGTVLKLKFFITEDSYHAG